MEYKGVSYSVVQTIDKTFKWTVNLTNRQLSGEAHSRDSAIAEAINVIDKDQRRMGRATSGHDG
jgi:hypothetical protein